MTMRKHRKFVHENDLVAEVEVDLIDADEAWGPYLSLDDVQKLDDVRVALRNGDIEAALKKAKVFRLTPVTAG